MGRIALAAVIALGLGAAARAQAASPLAVGEFVMADAPGRAGGDWAVGLSELLQHRLGELGVVTVERAVVTAVLSERRLQTLHPPRQRQSQGLLGAQFILTGRVHRLKGNNQYRIDAELVRTNDGSLVGRLSAQGAYPDEWFASVAEIAAQTVAVIDGQTGAEGKPRVPTDITIDASRFTRSPELAVLFYRGMGHLAGNRLPEAAAHFHYAWKNDHTGFKLARAWEMRTYQLLGFSELADAIRRQLMTDDPALAQLLDGNGAEAAGNEAAPWAVAGLGHIDPELARGLLNSLTGERRVRMLGDSAIGQVMREHDLSLSDSLRNPEGRGQIGWASSALLFAEATDDEHLTLILQDAATGVVRQSLTVARPEGATSLQWGQAAAKQLHEAALLAPPAGPDAAAATEARRDKVSWLRTPYDLWDKEYTGYASTPNRTRTNIDIVASLLRRLQAHPGNLSYIQAVMFWLDAPLREALANRLMDLVVANPRVPDAAAWLSSAGAYLSYARFEAAKGTQEDRFNAELPVEITHAALLKHYPDSPEAAIVRYTQANEHLFAGRTKEGLDLLVQLCETLPDARVGASLRLPYSAMVNLYFHTAAESYRAGDVERADTYLRRCLGEIQAHNEGRSHSHPVGPVFQTFTYVDERTGEILIATRNFVFRRQCYERMMLDWNDLQPQIDQLGKCIERALADPVSPPPFETARDLMLRAVGTADTQQALALHLRSIDTTLEHWVADRRWVDMTTLLQAAWMVLASKSDDQRTTLDQRLQSIADNSTSGTYRMACLMLAGREDEVRRTLEGEAQGLNLTTVIKGILNQIEQDTLSQTPHEQRLMLRKQVERFERDFPDLVRQDHLWYAQFIMELTDIACWLDEAAFIAARLEKLHANAKGPAGLRQQLAIHLAYARFYADQPFEATELLRAAVNDLSLGRLRGENDETISYSAISKLISSPQDALANAVFKLRFVRHYGGYSDLFRVPPSATTELPSLTERQRRVIVAAILPLHRTFTETNKWCIGTYWAESVPRLLAEAGESGRPIARQLMHTWYVRQLTSGIVSRIGSLDNDHLRFILDYWLTQGDAALDILPELGRVLAFEHAARRNVAMRTAGMLGEKANVLLPAVLLTCGDPCASCAITAREQLPNLGAATRDHLPALRRLLEHPNAHVHARAAALLAPFTGIEPALNADGLPNSQTIDAVRTWAKTHSAPLPAAMEVSP